MTGKNVRVRVDATQVVDGREYKGSVSFDDHRFQYNLKFGVPLDNLDDLAAVNLPAASYGASKKSINFN